MAAPGPVLEGVELSSANVERAVLQFYQVQDNTGLSLLSEEYIYSPCTLQTSATSQETIQETHKWLTLAQLSPQAWNFCWDLIHQDKKHEVQFFGASCLAVKVTSEDGDDVPDDADNDLDAGVAMLGGAAPGPVRWSPPEAG